MAKNAITQLEHAAYSPDLAPSDFWLFDDLKELLRGIRLESVEAIRTEAARALRSIPASEYQKCFESWKRRMHRCIGAAGEYFEGDKCFLPNIILYKYRFY